jgi:hypothetical protein
MFNLLSTCPISFSVASWEVVEITLVSSIGEMDVSTISIVVGVLSVVVGVVGHFIGVSSIIILVNFVVVDVIGVIVGSKSPPLGGVPSGEGGKSSLPTSCNSSSHDDQKSHIASRQPTPVSLQPSSSQPMPASVLLQPFSVGVDCSVAVVVMGIVDADVVGGAISDIL